MTDRCRGFFGRAATSKSQRRLALIHAHGIKVGVTARLMLDNDHPGDVGRARIMLWEVRRVTRIEAWQKRRWRWVAG